MKMIFNIISVDLSVERELYGSVVVPMVTYAAETLGMRMDVSHELDVMVLKV